METQILREKNLVMSSLNTSQGIKIIIRVSKNDGDEVYEGELPPVDKQEIISIFFKSSQEIIDYMKIRENIQIDIELMTIKVLSKVNTKNTKFIKIFQINLIPIKMDMSKILSLIISDCNIQGELSQDTIKKSIKTMAQTLKKLITENQFRQTNFNSNNLLKQSNKNQQFSLLKQQFQSFVQNQINNKKFLEERVTAIEQRFSQEYKKIVNQISNLGQVVSLKLDERLNEMSSIFATSQETEIIIKKFRVLGLQIEKLQNKLGKNDDQIQSELITEKVSSFNFLWKQKIFVQGNKITYRGQNHKPTHYIFNKIIPKNKIFKFKIRILHLKQSISIGILDYQKRKNQRCSSFKDSYSYWSNGRGYNYNKLLQTGKQFRQGDIVEVIIDLQNFNIKWQVNGILGMSCTDIFLRNSKIIFMPFVEFRIFNSSVQLIEE